MYGHCCRSEKVKVQMLDGGDGKVVATAEVDIAEFLSEGTPKADCEVPARTNRPALQGGVVTPACGDTAGGDGRFGESTALAPAQPERDQNHCERGRNSGPSEPGPQATPRCP
jgi:hypothetical protein